LQFAICNLNEKTTAFKNQMSMMPLFIVLSFVPLAFAVCNGGNVQRGTLVRTADDCDQAFASSSWITTGNGHLQFAHLVGPQVGSYDLDIPTFGGISTSGGSSFSSSGPNLFEKRCQCGGQMGIGICSEPVSTTSCLPGQYAITKLVGSSVTGAFCVTVSSQGTLLNTEFFLGSPNPITLVEVHDGMVLLGVYSAGAIEFDAAGNLINLAVSSGNDVGAFWGECGPMVITTPTPAPTPLPTAEATPPLAQCTTGTSVRFRSFANTGGKEHFLGVGDLGVGGNRVEQEITWANPSNNSVFYEYQQRVDAHQSTVNALTTLLYGSLASRLQSKTSCTLQSLTQLRIAVLAQSGATVNVRNIVATSVSGATLPFDVVGTSTFTEHLINVPAADLLSDFSVSAVVQIGGTFSASQEASRVQIHTCCIPISTNSIPNAKKRSIDGASSSTASFGKLVPTTGGGDPHLKGLFGIKFDVFGKPNGNYSLLSAPAFEVNMQLAQVGPAKRFMTRMSVLYRGTSVSFDGWALLTRKAELIKHFEALNATVKIDGWVMTIDPCPQHQLKFVAMHSGNINYLDLAVSVPGCHKSYGGLLGQTYQCKYATDKFQWSRDKEESFALPTLETPSGSYSPATAECTHEDEFKGEPIHGATQSTDGAVEMMGNRRR
jgi:hypothetical protein